MHANALKIFMSEEIKNENWVRKVLTTEVKYILGIIIFVAGVVAPYYSIKQDIALIQQNHFLHMETMQKDIEELQKEQKDLKNTEIELMKTISERLPARSEK
jgi:uncharacterized membrane protein (DUF106 family)